MMPRINLRPKVTATVMAVSVLAMSAAAVTAYRAMRETVTAEFSRSADAVARGLGAAAKVPMAVGGKDELGRLAALSVEANRLAYVRFVGRDGAEICRVDAAAPAQAPQGNKDIISGSVEVRIQDHRAGDLDLFDSVAPQDDGKGTQLLGSVEVGIPASLIDARMSALAALFVKIVVGAGVVIGGIMWFLAGAWTKRLDKLVDASGRIARGELDSPLADPGRDEIGRLTDAFGRMRLAVKQRDDEARRFNETLQEQVRARTIELEDAMHAAQAANRAKSDFLANMSHEIRTPMTAIIGFAELLNDPAQTPDARRECVGTINRSGRHLLTIINDILDISKIEAGKMTVEPIDCAPAAIVHDVVSLMRERATEQGIGLSVVFDTPVPSTISSDPLRFRQVLLNLVGNAVKFTQRGSVTLHVSADREKRTFTVAVHDTGIGIAPEHTANLFRPFSQSDNTMSRRFGGTGLGLTIAKRFSELLGGDLTLQSKLGEGSVFTVTVSTGPLENVPFVSGDQPAAPAIAAPAAPKAALTGFRFLLAEDGVDNQRLLKLYLTKAGASVTIAENGRIACEAVTAANERNEPFDLILMDMQMPEMDGYAASTHIRKTGNKIPIIALTAHALVGDRQRCLAAGCSDYLTKPVDRALLVDLCRRWKENADALRAAA